MLKPKKIEEIPEITRVAKAAFPKGNRIMKLRDVFGTVYEDEDFKALFPDTGQPALAPWHLVLATVFQFLEGLSDTPCEAQAEKRRMRSGAASTGSTR